MTSSYHIQLQELLQKSTLTPGVYTPTHQLKNADHWAVIVDRTPVLITGPADDLESAQQANDLAKSRSFRNAVKALDLDGEIYSGVVEGATDINWPDVCDAVVSSKSGEIAVEGDIDDLMTISLIKHPGLTTFLCINTDLARIIDPNAPELDDGRHLASLISPSTSSFAFH